MPLGPDHRYVFVGGLHRSGTSLIARLIGEIPGVHAIQDAPVPENEGVYLQGAIPHHALSGIPMHFATDPAQHMTEFHPLNRLDTRQRLEADWAPWFHPGPGWRVEKSPVNLTRMRLLQQLFPMAHFVIVIRHPEAVAAAVSKWTDRPASDLMDHWLDAYDRVLADMAFLHAARVVRYEDLVRAPHDVSAGLAAFLASARPQTSTEAIRDGNADYDQAAAMSDDQARRATDWGYGPRMKVDPAWHMPTQHPLRHIRDQTDGAFRGNQQ